MDLSHPQGHWQPIMVYLKNNCIQVLVINNSDQAMKLKRGKLVASADMRSKPCCTKMPYPEWTGNWLLCGSVLHWTEHTSPKHMNSQNWDTSRGKFNGTLRKGDNQNQGWLSLVEWWWSMQENDWQTKLQAVHRLEWVRPDCKGKVKDDTPNEILPSIFSMQWIGKMSQVESSPQITWWKSIFHQSIQLHEEHMQLLDKEMRCGYLLGILKKGLSSYSSPIMLIPWKHTKLVHIITDFRVLNSCLGKLNPSIPLVCDAIQMLGAAECKVISVCDLWDTYHSMPLDEYSKRFCGITPYYGSSSYIYQRLGMGLSASSAFWQHFINKIMEEIPDHSHHFTIMDDCLIHSTKDEHWYHLTNLFIKHGLKMSPKKCQFFRKKLTYMGHTIIIDGTTPCITAHKSHLDAIQKLTNPKLLGIANPIVVWSTSWVCTQRICRNV